MLIEVTHGKSLLDRSRRKGKDKIFVKEIGYEDANGIQLA
jgi:hypothetical protein